MTDFYIDPKDAVRIRVHGSGDAWFIDAVNAQGRYTEECWDSYKVGPHWYRMDTCAIALARVREFAKEVCPHLLDTRPFVPYDCLREEVRNGSFPV